MRLYKVCCDLCGKDQPKFLGNTKENTIVQCQNCQHIYLKCRPLAKDLKKIFTKEYFNEKYIQENVNVQYCYEKDKKNIVAFARKRFDTIEKYLKPGKVLDIGCALGFYLEEGRKRGWEPYGIEISEYAANYAIQKLGLDVQTVDMEKAVFKKNFFDFITLWLVMEHFVDPVKKLKKISQWLKKGGFLGIKVPHAGGLTFKFNFDTWVKQHTEDHYCDYNISNMTRLLDKIGFDVVAHETEGIYLERALTAFHLQKEMKKISKKSTAYQTLSDFYAVLAKKIDLGDSLVVFAKKR